MIKDTFVFSKNSWHMKLMTWIWGYTTQDFRNMCPYFWLSVFNILFIIPIVVVKLLGKGFGYLFDFISYLIDTYSEYCTAKEQAWVQEMLAEVKKDLNAKKADSPILEKLYNYEVGDNKVPKKYRELLYQLGRKQRSTLYNLGVESVLSKRATESAKPKTNSQAIAKLTVYIKLAVKILVYIGLAVGAFYLVKFVIYLFSLTANIDWYKVAHLFTILGECLLGLIIGVIVSVLIVKFVQYLGCKFGKYCVPCERKRNKINSFFQFLGRVLVLPIKGIIYIVEVIIALKKDNCPGIEWKD